MKRTLRLPPLPPCDPLDVYNCIEQRPLSFAPPCGMFKVSPEIAYLEPYTPGLVAFASHWDSGYLPAEQVAMVYCAKTLFPRNWAERSRTDIRPEEQQRVDALPAVKLDTLALFDLLRTFRVFASRPTSTHLRQITQHIADQAALFKSRLGVEIMLAPNGADSYRCAMFWAAMQSANVDDRLLEKFAQFCIENTLSPSHRAVAEFAQLFRSVDVPVSLFDGAVQSFQLRNKK